MRSPQQSSIPSRVIYQAKKNSQVDMLKYPADLGAHSLIFDFVKYDYQNAGGQGNGFVTTQQVENTQASISLPLPQDLPEVYSVGYGDQELGYLGQMFMKGRGILSDIEAQLSSVGGMSDLGAAVGGISMDVASMATDSSQYLIYKTISGLPGGDAYGVSKGIALNPALTAVLDSVPLREHTFSWTFSPRNEAEQETLAIIHNKIAKYMHPELGGFGVGDAVNGVLKYPFAVDIRMVGKDPRYTMKFKRAFITNCTLNPTEGGHHMHKGSGAPVFLNFTISVKETQSIVASDFNEDLV